LFSFSAMADAERLSSFPYVRVRIARQHCPRKGSYRLARLAAKYGPEVDLEALISELAFDCPRRRKLDERPPGKYGGMQCRAYFVDLLPPHRPPDLPRGLMKLRVVPGGRR
jgi:hypothetical protein